MKSLACVLIAAVLLTQEPAENTSGGRLLDEQAAFDVLHYDLELDVDPEKKSIEGRLEMRAALLDRTREIALHLDPALEVRSVRMGRDDLESTEFRHVDGIVWIEAEGLPDEEG
ncbi:MAG: hypothetical protein AAF726_24445, partial [Planctomycetota bacterium]